MATKTRSETRPALTAAEAAAARAYLQWRRDHARRAVDRLRSVRGATAEEGTSGMLRYWQNVVAALEWATDGLRYCQPDKAEVASSESRRPAK